MDQVRAIVTIAKSTFLKWTRLYPLYLLVLVLIGVGEQLVFRQWTKAITDPGSVALWLVAAAVCSGCYVAGPLLETSLVLFGLRWRRTTLVLFLAGSLATLPVHFLVTFFLAFVWATAHS